MSSAMLRRRAAAALMAALTAGFAAGTAAAADPAAEYSADVSLETAISEAGKLEAVMMAKVPEVKEVVSRIGSPAVATDIMGLEQADVFVLLKPKETWRPGVDKVRIIEEIDRAAKSVNASAEVSFTQPIQMRFNELLGGSVADVTISIYGDDLAELDRLAARTAEVAGKVPRRRRHARHRAARRLAPRGPSPPARRLAGRASP